MPSPPFEPDEQGNTVVFAAFEAVTSLPEFPFVSNVSQDTVLACIDRTLFNASRDRMNGARIHSFMVDPSILDFSDATDRSHHALSLALDLPHPAYANDAYARP